MKIRDSTGFVLKIGKGVDKGWRGSLGTFEGSITQEDGRCTISGLAKRLARQMKIKNGELTILSVEFVVRERTDAKVGS